jgi:ketosteroid isomerase-like protein
MGDLAYHDYSYSGRFTPKAGGEPGIGHGKGLQVLRREPDGAWKIVRNVWNAAPPPSSPA